MADESKTLKSQNWKYIIPYIGLHLIAFYIIIVGADNVWKLTEAAIKSTLWGAGLATLAVILNGLLSSHLKAVLVFWRPRHPLPGCRAFSHYLDADSRIAPRVLENRLGKLPSDPTTQNSLWYGIYRRHENHPSVRDAHGSFLLSRDLAGLSAMFLVTLGLSAIYLSKDTKQGFYYFIATAVLYILTAQAARTYGKRLVTSVLAIETSS